LIQALKALFQKPVAELRPDLGSLLGVVAGPVLVVDGALPAAAGWAAAPFGDTTVVRQAARGEDPAGVPFAEGDPSALPPHAGGWPAIVLVDVLDRVLDPLHALTAVREALAPAGRVLLLQAVAPDDPGARADWNVLGRLRDADHTWTPTRRQLRALPAGAGLDRGTEVLWAETVELSGVRAETREALEAFAADVDGGGLFANGRLAVTRLALVLAAS